MDGLDLRMWLEDVKRLGQLKDVREADWDVELGAIAELVRDKSGQKPALLFDAIKGYPEGYRVLVNMLNSVERLSLTTGVAVGKHPIEFIQEWRKRISDINPIKPVVVDDGPVMENVHMGEDVNLEEFPVPRWHEEDGGRYIGTGSLTITRDPDEGWVNFGTYRVMMHNKNTVGFYISPGKHGRIQRDKYLQRGEPCPVAISIGHHPLMFIASSTDVPYGMCEYDYVGGLLGRPVEVINGPVTGLPIPAHSEIVIEGEVIPGDTMREGPFGEWTGYYASAARQEPVIRVKSVLHRNNPIISGSPPFKPSAGDGLYRSMLRSALIWDALERTGVPDVTAVRVHEAAGRFLTIVAIKQRYPGHARQAAMVASQCRPGAYLGRYVIVVDDDIDIFDTDEVIWAVSTRSDPETSIDIIRRAWSGPLDPIIPADKKGFSSRAIIDACRPYEWRDKFPPVVGASPRLRKEIETKWAALWQ